jgi:hypothetical protein
MGFKRETWRRVGVMSEADGVKLSLAGDAQL